MSASASKVTAEHRCRRAFLYVRQSTLKQVLENQESTRRQYDLRQRAVALGWPLEEIVVIDDDLAQSGSSATHRDGFQALVSEVGMGRAGLVMGLEVSRLARNSADWHRLLELCALTHTLILDEDGLYDLAQFNDRLLLGLKGTMSEAELHLLRSRLRGGILNKAKRGELSTLLPVGLQYDLSGKVVLDEDSQVQATIRLFFQTFRRLGAASATVKEFRREKIPFPRRARGGSRALSWGPLRHSQTLRILRNPRYAGAYAFGKTRGERRADGKVSRVALPVEKWTSLVRDAHPGYLTWEEFEQNQQTLAANARACGADRKSPPREGPALLQGLVVCGCCGRRMTLRYHRRRGQLLPDYVCGRVEEGEQACQVVPGGGIDQRVGAMLLELMTPVALEVALAVRDELETRLDEADRLRHKQVERAGYEAELARRRYMQATPENRLVADVLEGEWNEKLRLYREAQDEYERRRQVDRTKLSEDQRRQVVALASDFPRLWNNPDTSTRDRKRVIRLLVEDVTLMKGGEITAQIRLRGGTARTLKVPRPQPAWLQRKTSPEVVEVVDQLLDGMTDGQVAEELNKRGYLSGTGKPFLGRMVATLRRAYALKSRWSRLRDGGYMTGRELAIKLGVHPATIKTWRQKGRLKAVAGDDKGTWLYAPGVEAPKKYEWDRPSNEPVLQRIDELLNQQHDDLVAVALNESGARTALGGSFSAATVGYLRRVHGLKSHHQRLRDRGMLTGKELAKLLGVKPATIRKWRLKGRIQAHCSDGGRGYLYEPPRNGGGSVTPDRHKEV